MNFKERVSDVKKKQWIKLSIALIITILFVLWSGYYGLLILLPLFFDSYITKYIPWTFWKKSKNKVFKKTMEWIDAIGFALIAVYFINTFFFQNYQIPSSSLEKSLLVGDFLCVSKVSYGARSAMTPFSFPLVQHTFPILNTKSYLEKPQMKYKRLAGFGQVKRGDIVVFNFPAGDTVAVNAQTQDYYSLCKENSTGRAGVWADKATYGDIVYRPVDRRENYVKRCVGLPGDILEIKDDVVYIGGKALKDPDNMQVNYYVQTDGTTLSGKMLSDMGISKEDYDRSSFYPTTTGKDSLQLIAKGYSPVNNFGIAYELPLTKKMYNELKAKPFVLKIFKVKEEVHAYQKANGEVLNYPYYYPIAYETGWLRDNYGPLWIPKRGETITFDKDVDFKVATYERCIKNYEGNEFDYRDGKVYINGKQADSYTFNYDYYFMMGDNRHKSADSRSWGFVPEDHIVGQPLFVWLSLDKDKSWFSHIRWSRIFTSAKSN